MGGGRGLEGHLGNVPMKRSVTSKVMELLSGSSPPQTLEVSLTEHVLSTAMCWHRSLVRGVLVPSFSSGARLYL